MQMDNGNMSSSTSRSLERQNPRNWEFSPVFRTTSGLNPLVPAGWVGLLPLPAFEGRGEGAAAEAKAIPSTGNSQRLE